MRRTARWVCVLALSLGAPLAAGCGSSADSPAAPGTGDFEARLLNDTGVTWLVDRDDVGAPIILTAIAAPPPATGGVPRDQAAIAFLQRYADLFKAGDLTNELVLVEDREDRDSPGVHHLRFAQRIPGSNVRAFGADTFVHFDANGAIRFVGLGFVNEIAKLSAQPAKSADEARVAAEATVLARDPQAVVSSPNAPALVVHRAEDGKGTLAWRVRLQARVDGALEAPEVFIDATSSAVLEANDTAAHANRTIKASNVYYYHADCGQKVPANESTITYDDAFLPVPGGLPVATNHLVRNGDALHSTLVTDAYLVGDQASGLLRTAPILATDPTSFDFIDNHQGSGAGVSTHENLALTDTYFRTLGQQGWDGPGVVVGTATLPIFAAVHAWVLDPTRPKTKKRPLAGVADLTVYVNDAIYLGDGITQANPFTAPNCDFFPAGVSLDVVAHEFTHGVVDHTANLGNKGEAGALNEAIADVLGASAEHSVRPGHLNFLIGEEAFFATGGLRDLSAPRNMEATFPNEEVPRAYSERLSMTALDKDNGHVHDNAVIGGHAFYLMTMGGTNAVTHVTVAADQALGWTRAPWVWYAALIGMDRRLGAKYLYLARLQTNQAMLLAMPFPGSFPTATAATACAWRAVDVFTDADLKAYGVTCGASPAAPAPPPPPGGGASVNEPNPCAGHGDNLVCDAAAPTNALVCHGGVLVAVVVCADLQLRCKKASDADPTATVDADGALVCE